MIPSLLPDQRNSVTEKQNRDWYVPTMNYLIALAERSTDITEVITCINATNGIIDDNTTNYVMGALSSDIRNKLKTLPPDIREVDIMTPIKEKQISEYISLPYNYYVTAQNPDVTLDRDNKLANAISEIISQEFIKILNQQGIDTGQQPQPTPQDLNKFKDAFLKKWANSECSDAKRKLDVVCKEIGFDTLRIELFFDYWATQRFYTHRRVVNNKVVTQRVPPQEGFPIYNGKSDVEDMDGFLWKRRVTFNSILDEYGDQLPKEELDYIYALLDTNIGDDANYSLPPTLLQSRLVSNKQTNVVNTSSVFMDNSRSLWQYIISYKTLVPVRILTYMNQFGEVEETHVDDSYVFDELHGDMNIANTYISQTWSGIRWGNENTGVYLPLAPIEVPRLDEETNLSKLNFGGRVGIINKDGLNPIPKRLLPYAALYKIYTYQQEITIAKYQRALKLMPQSVMNPDKNFSTQEKLMYMKLDDTVFYDDTEIDFNTIAQGTKVMLDQGVEAYIQGLENLKQNVKAEAWALCGMNNPRMGLTDPSAGKSINETNLHQAQLQSILMIHFFNKQLEKEHEADLDYSKIAWINGKELVYLNDKKELIDLNLDPEKHINYKFKINVSNSVEEAIKLKDFKDMAFSASQHGDFSLASIAITSNDRYEIETRIEEFTTMTKQFEAEQANKQAEATKYAADLASQDKMAELDNARYIAEIQVQAKLEGNNANPTVDFTDPLESYRDTMDSMNKAKANELKEKQLNHKIEQDKKKNVLQDKKIEADRYIARVNKQ